MIWEVYVKYVNLGMHWIVRQVNASTVMDVETVIQVQLRTVLHVFLLKFLTKHQRNVSVSTVLQIVFNVLLMVNVQHVILDFIYNHPVVYLVKFSIVNNVILHHLLVILVLMDIFITVQK